MLVDMIDELSKAVATGNLKKVAKIRDEFEKLGVDAITVSAMLNNMREEDYERTATK